MSWHSIRFPNAQVSLAQPFSNLEARAEKHALGLTERRYSESRGAQRAARAFSRFLADKDGERSLKKSLHIAYEARLKTLALRQDPPTTYGFLGFDVDSEHPLDALALEDVKGLDSGGKVAALKIKPRTRLLHFLAAVVYGLGFLGKAIIILICRSAPVVEPIHCRVATPNHWHKSRYIPLLEAARSVAPWTSDSMLFVVEKPSNDSVGDLGIRMLRLNTDLRVPRRDWAKKVALPAIRLLLSNMVNAARSVGDPVAMEASFQSMRLAKQSLLYWQIAMNVHCRFFLDIGDYTPDHVLKRIILAKFGTKMVRWPGSQSDTYSSITSYLAFDIYFSGGVYQQNTFGCSWSDRVKVLPIGSPQFDIRMLSGERLDPEYERLVTDRIERGQKLAAYFGTSPIAPMEPIELDSLLAACRQTAQAEDWFLVIKPKGASSSLAEAAAKDTRFEDYLNHPDIIWVEYPPDMEERCPSGWLIEKMAFGVGDQGSVMTEALSRRKPYFAYYPIAFPTPLRERLLKDGFFFTKSQDLEHAVSRAINDFPDFRKPSEYDYYVANFGHFEDNSSLDRLTEFLFGENGDPA